MYKFHVSQFCRKHVGEQAKPTTFTLFALPALSASDFSCCAVFQIPNTTSELELLPSARCIANAVSISNPTSLWPAVHILPAKHPASIMDNVQRSKSRPPTVLLRSLCANSTTNPAYKQHTSRDPATSHLKKPDQTQRVKSRRQYSTSASLVTVRRPIQSHSA